MAGNLKLVARAYQLEMLDASMQGNIIAVMATGTGKTHIAAMRIQAELERSTDKLVWFTVPTVPLAFQQRDFLASQLAEYQVRTLTGEDGVEFWKSQTIWDAALLNINVVVSTPQVLQDALSNAFVRLKNISLFVIDEAHHCQTNTNSPSTLIMRNHYHPFRGSDPDAVPHILGLTASVRIGARSPEIHELENILNATCLGPTITIDEYTAYVNSPRMLGITYNVSSMSCSVLYMKLCDIVAKMDFRQDPVYKRLQKNEDDRSRQKLAKWERAGCTDSTKEIIAFKKAVEDLNLNLGTWAADDFMRTCIDRWRGRSGLVDIPTMSERFVTETLAPMENLTQVDFGHAGVSDKARALIDFLMNEYHQKIAVIVFVERRSTAYALCRLLKAVPDLRHIRAFTFAGRGGRNTNSFTEVIDEKQQRREFAEFRGGLQDVCIATSVAEEGIDIQAVNIVVRFDDTKTLKALIQSRGRARRPNSKFIYFYSSPETIAKYSELLRLEEEAEAELKADRDALGAHNDLDPLCDEEYKVESSGAKLFHSNAVTHVQHFCSIVAKTDPLYVLSGEPGVDLRAKVILPSCVPIQYQEFNSLRSWCGEKAARRDAAFQAYKALHGAGMVTNNFVPFQPERSKRTQIRNEGKKYEIAVERCVWSQEGGSSTYFLHRISFHHDSNVYAIINIAIPRSIDHDLRFMLYENTQFGLEVEVRPLGPLQLTNITAAKRLTRDLFAAAFQAGTAWGSLEDSTSIPFLILPIGTVSTNLECTEQTFPQFLKQFGSGVLNHPLFVWKQSNYHHRRPHLWSPSQEECGTSFTTIKARKCRKVRLHFSAPKIGSGPSEAAKMEELSINQCTFRGIESILGPSTGMIPSVLHFMTLALRAQDAKESFFPSIGFRNSELLTPALTAVSASGYLNYEKLEFLGDAYLKFRVSLQLFHDEPLAMEGMLTDRFHKLTNNERLHQYTRDSGLADFVSTEVPASRHWRLPQIFSPDIRPLTRNVSSKTLADVVESILAAALLEDEQQEDGVDRSTAMLSLIYPEIEWWSPEGAAKNLRSLYCEGRGADPLVDYISQMTGYTFNRTGVLREALTHSTSRPGSLSYNRLEFLGDAILDWIIKLELSKHENLTPGSMTIMRHAIASHSFLAACSLRIATTRLHQDIELCDGIYTPKNIHEAIFLTDLIVFHEYGLRSPVNAARLRLETIKQEIDYTMTRNVFPWTLLRSLNAPKVCSDVVESLLAAVYVDSGGSLASCEEVARNLGILKIMDYMLGGGFDARTPATILREASAARGWIVDIQPVKGSESTTHVSRVLFSNAKGVFHEFVGPEACCTEEARSLVAEQAFKLLDSVKPPVGCTDGDCSAGDGSAPRVLDDDVSSDEGGVVI